MNPPCYDEDLVKSIIFRCLNKPSRIINVHPKSDYWYSNISASSNFENETIDILDDR
ncbi:36003_t:CDS:1, partial [Gigaspora margarita]